jgi:hypothetical protein
MAKKVINAFNAGEVSPYVHARQDSELYDKACLKMENFIPLEYGGVTKRPATKFVHLFEDTLTEPVGQTKLYNFILNSEETYILCFTNSTLTIFKNNVIVTSIPTVYPDNSLQKLKFIQSNDVLFIASEDYPIHTLRRYDEDKFELQELDYVFPPMGNDLEVDFSPDSKSGQCTITAGSDYFEESHVGGFLVIQQRRDLLNSSISESLLGGVTNSVNTSFANYEIESSGSNWTGKVVLEKSIDGGDSFSPEFTLVDTSAGAIAPLNDTSGNYTNRTFSSTEKEGANTFIRLRFYPALSTGGGTASLRIKVDDPYVTGLFRIDSVNVDNRTATGVWLSPIQDIEEGYTNNVFDISANFLYKRGDKIVFVGDFSADVNHGTKGELAIADLGTGGNFSENQDDFIDMCFSTFGSQAYMYALTNDDKIVRYNYNLDTGAIDTPLIRSLTYTNQYIYDAFGRGQENNQAHFGIASAGDGNIYVLLRSSGTTTAKNTQIRINYFTETAFNSADIGDAEVTNLFARPQNTHHHTFGLQGLGYGNNKFYWKAHEKWRAGKKKPYQAINRYMVDLDGKNFHSVLVGYQYGKSPKSTANGTFDVHNFKLGQEPAYNDVSITDGRTMVRDQMDSIYLNGYLLCLDDRQNKIVFRNLDYKDTGLSYTLSDSDGTAIDKTFWGMDSVPAQKLLGKSELIIGTKYKLVANVTVTAQKDYLKTLGFDHAKDTFTAGDTFIATQSGLDTAGSTTLQGYGIKVVIDNSNIDRATNVDVNVIVLYKDADTTNGAIGDNPKLLRLTFDGEVDYYQATRDFVSDDYTNATFNSQRQAGLWAKSLPKIVKSQESAYSSKNGYPNSISIFENRLCFGGNKKFPNRLWMSKTDDLNNFTTGSEATASLDLTFNSLTQDEITWLCAGRELNIGTMTSEWTLGSGNQSLPVTPTQLNLKRRSEYGSSATQGLLVNSAILFIMRQGKKVREWYLQNNQNDYLAQDLTAIAEHIIGDGVREIAVQTQPSTIVWVVCNNGDLVGLTYERETNTFAWHRHTFDGEVESVSVIPQVDGEDVVYLSIKKTDDLITGLNVAKFNISISSSREDQSGGSTDGQEINITADSTKHVTPSITHTSPTASAIVLPVNQANGSSTSPTISNISTVVYGFKGRIKSFTPNNDRIHIVPETITVSGAVGNATTLAANGTYTLTEDIFNQPAWDSGTHTIQVNQELAIDPSTGLAYASTAQGSTHNVKWQIIRKSDSAVIVQHNYTNDEFPARGNGTTTWSHNQSGSGTVLLTGDGYPFTSDHIGLPVVYLNLTTTPNRTPDIGGLTHGTTYYLKAIPASGDDQTLNRILTLQSSGDTTGNGTIIDITNNSAAIKAETKGVFNLKNHFLASAVFATPRVNTFTEGISGSSNDVLYNVGSPSTNTNFSKIMTFNDGDICGVDIFIWNEDSGNSKEGNDAFIEYEGDPTVTIDATATGGTQTKVSLIYDTVGEYNVDVYIEDTGTGVVETVKTGEGIQPRLLSDRYLVQFDLQKHESAYTKKYSGLDYYVRNKNFTGTSFTGLDHLENQTVTYKVNGGNAVGTAELTARVTDGAITIASVSNANVVAGIPFTSTLAPLYVDADGSIGSKKSVSHATIRFKDTLEAKVGQKETSTDDVKFGSTSSLNTEDAEVWLANHNEFLQTVYVISDTPHPCTVLAMVIDVEGV